MPIAPSAAEREAVLARELGLPRPFVRNVTRRLKDAGRIGAARPVPPPLTSRDLARMILACCAVAPVHAPATAENIGTLPRVAGAGAINVEVELIDLIDAMAGHVESEFDFSEGELILSADGEYGLVQLHSEGGALPTRIYRTSAPRDGIQRVTVLPVNTIARIARQLL